MQPPDTKWNSSTCRSQWALLGRISKGPRAKQFPQLAAFFNGSADEKQQALCKFMSANEDPGAAEASFSVRKGHSDVTNRNRQWLTPRPWFVPLRVARGTLNHLYL